MTELCLSSGSILGKTLVGALLLQIKIPRISHLYSQFPMHFGVWEFFKGQSKNVNFF